MKVKELYKKHKEIISYIFFGALTTAVSFVSYTVFVLGLDSLGAKNISFFGTTLSVCAANIVSWVCAVLFAFITNKLWVFESKSFEKNVALAEFVKFISSRIATGVLEIVLLIIGGAIFVLSFVLPKNKEEMDAETRKFAKEQIRTLLDRELAVVQSKIEDTVSDTIEESASETERTLKKMTNEKIMAISEYSNTVIEDINKNHKEVLFLYDMLNDKHATIKSAVTEVEKSVGEAVQTAKDIEISARETAKEVKSSEEAAKRAADIANRVEKAAEMIQGKVDESRDEVASLMEMQSVSEVYSNDIENLAMNTKDEKEEADSDVILDSKIEAEETAVPVEMQEEAAESEDDFVQGITTGAPKIIFEDENEENPQFRVVEPQDVSNSNERILALHEEGMSNVAIAKELGLGVGEVKLVIDLFEGASR